MVRFLKFEAPWCGQCKAQDKLLKDSGLPIQHVDVDENEDLVDLYNVKSMPTMILVDENDNELSRFNGITPVEELKAKYNELKQ